MVTIGIPKEIHPGEKRVAATPQTILKLKKLGFEVAVETNAGHGINCSDSEFREAGAEIVDTPKELWATSDVILKVRPPEQNAEVGVHEADLMKEGGWLIGFMWPAQNRELLDRLGKRKATVFAMDCVPRITRAQKMDTLSAMANIAGYRAVIEAANNFPRFFGGQITAAGRIDPAKVMVIGAGVAGLSAIGAARALGAIVRAFDPRSACKDQVASMGAEFLELNVEEEGEGKGGYAKQMSDDFLKAEMALFAAAGDAGRYYRHDRAYSRQARAKTYHTRHGRIDETRQRHCRSRGGARRQLRPHRSRQNRSSQRRRDYRLHRSAVADVEHVQPALRLDYRCSDRRSMQKPARCQ